MGACAVVLLLAASVATGKEWRGIVPLKSTRVDVERLLGVAKRSTDSLLYYKLRTEIVVVHFEHDRCDSESGKFGYGWNVPIGTVTDIAVIPRGTHRLEEYKVGNNFKVEDVGAGFIYHTDAAAGLTIETLNNQVTLVEYHAEKAQHTLQCPRVYECCVDFFPKFDEYMRLPFGDEKARLDNFVINLEAAFFRGTIQVVGPSSRDRQQLSKLAARAKNYLVRERGFEPERLLIVDAGFEEQALTRLAEHSIGGAGTRIYLHTRKDPAEQRRSPN
jgi:hypothetical protein